MSALASPIRSAAVGPRNLGSCSFAAGLWIEVNQDGAELSLMAGRNWPTG